MDTRLLFRGISDKLRIDFATTSQILHNGSRGTVRENGLRKFLCEGRLPYKYAVGSGEIVGRTRDTSRQSDLIIYDRLNGIMLLYDEQTQVIPIDCVYGIIECKSSLSKSELVDSLEKVKHFKKMAPKGVVVNNTMVGFISSHPRPTPFGMIFAYSLGANSLDSLQKNLRDWEAENDPENWPNYICVLGEGTIFHQLGSQRRIDSSDINRDCVTIAIPYKGDALYEFYFNLLDACGRMQLGSVELEHYRDPGMKVGRFVIRGRFEFELTKDGVKREGLYTLKESAVQRIVSWCAGQPPITYQQTIVKRFGYLVPGFEATAYANARICLYNPDSLPGLHETGSDNIIEALQSGAMRTIAHAHEVQIDGQIYAVDLTSFGDDDWESTT